MEAVVVIATIGRRQHLEHALEGWRNGTRLPLEVRVVDASRLSAIAELCTRDWSPLRVRHLVSSAKSAARQRNIGAAGCTSNIIVFCDDDVILPPNTLELLLDVFEQDHTASVGGVAGTIEGYHYRKAGRLLHAYYRMQAGYDHEHYGGHFFGPAINILPTDRDCDPILYPSHWLNSTLVAYRTEMFLRERFPDFDGYSFQEDVNLSVRIGRSHHLYFHRGLRYRHLAAYGVHKSDSWKLGGMIIRNRWYNATELLRLGGFRRSRKFALSLAMDSLWLLRARPSGWAAQGAGMWVAWCELVTGAA